MPARLIAVTEDARHALKAPEIVIERFPFTVGRENRTALTTVSEERERRLGLQPPVNDRYLVEPAVPGVHQVSRQHFLITLTEGEYFLIDRGSTCGTIVNGTRIGGNRRGGRIELHDRAQITVGSAASPLAFEFRIESPSSV